MGLETKPLPLWVWRPNPYHYGFGDQTPTIMGLETKPLPLWVWRPNPPNAMPVQGSFFKVFTEKFCPPYIDIDNEVIETNLPGQRKCRSANLTPNLTFTKLLAHH
jgi:hypothetical protein